LQEDSAQVTRNALGSRNACGRIPRVQTSERIVAVWGKRVEVVARWPIQIVNDKGRYHSRKAIDCDGWFNGMSAKKAPV